MLHALRKLARTIHRRSVWQVLAAFVLMSWLVLEIVEWMTRSVGLPLWTPWLAAVLLALGLPVVVATAVVQGGIPWLRITDVVDPNELEGRTPAEVHVVPEEHPMHGVGLLTWRNAVLGGVMAGALLVTSVVSYLAMWAFGVGPVGSLIAQGVLSEKDTLLVASLDNRTEEAGVGDAVTRGIRLALSRSTVVEIANDVGLSDAIGAVPGGYDEAHRAGVAELLGGHPNVAAVVDGEVLRVRGGYRIRVGIVSSEGVTLARFDAEVSEDEGTGPAVERLSARIRERIGESLRVIRMDTPP